MFLRKRQGTLSLLPERHLIEGRPSSPRYPPKPKRRSLKPVLALAAISLGLNVYLFVTTIKAWTAWPVPLDNYQSLNRHPMLDKTRVIPANPREHAVVTSLYTDAFAPAVATLGHTLHLVNSSAARLVFYFPQKVSKRALCIATMSGWEAVSIDRIEPPFPKRHYSHFLDQYSKLRLWTLDQLGYKTIAYLDSDTLVRRNFDELFHVPWTFAAVQDVYPKPPGFVTSFNAGMMVLHPDSALFHDMRSKIATARYPAFEAEQSFLNHYFGAEAVRLPYAYNANLAIKERAPEMWAALQDEIRILHLTMVKPFLQGDYAEVPLDDLERNAQQVASKFPIYKQEIEEWVETWKETRSAYARTLAQC